MIQQRNRTAGLAFAGIGAILIAISFFVANGYWFLLSGSVFVLIGLILALVFWRGLSPDAESSDKGTVDNQEGSPI